MHSEFLTNYFLIAVRAEDWRLDHLLVYALLLEAIQVHLVIALSGLDHSSLLFVLHGLLAEPTSRYVVLLS